MRLILALMTVLVTSDFILSFLRNILIAAHFGSNSRTDAYFVVYNLLITFAALFSSIIQTGIMPVFSELSSKRGREDGAKFLSSLLFVAILLLVLIIGVWLLICPFVVKCIFAGYSKSAREFLVHLFYQFSFIIIPLGATSILVIFMYYYKKMLAVSFSSVLNNLIFLGFFCWLWRKFDIGSLVIGGIVGAMVAFSFNYLFVFKAFRFEKYGFLLLRNNIPEIVRLIFPLLLSVGICQFIPWVEYFLSAYMPPGTYSFLSYARNLSEIPCRFIAVGATAFVFPALAKHFNDKDHIVLNQIMRSSLKFCLLFLLPVCTLASAFSEQIIQTVFARGKFSLHDAYFVSSAFKIYSFSLVGFGIGILLSYSFAALKIHGRWLRRIF